MIGLMGLGMGLFHGFLALVFNRMVGKQPFSFALLGATRMLKLGYSQAVAICWLCIY